MSSVDGNEDIRVAQLQTAWENELNQQEALNDRIDSLEAQLAEAYSALKDVYDAMQLLRDFTDIPFSAIKQGGWV